jgi:hypothetical protein
MMGGRSNREREMEAVLLKFSIFCESCNGLNSRDVEREWGKIFCFLCADSSALLLSEKKPIHNSASGCAVRNEVVRTTSEYGV